MTHQSATEKSAFISIAFSVIEICEWLKISYMRIYALEKLVTIVALY